MGVGNPCGLLVECRRGIRLHVPPAPRAARRDPGGGEVEASPLMPGGEFVRRSGASSRSLNEETMTQNRKDEGNARLASFCTVGVITPKKRFAGRMQGTTARVDARCPVKSVADQLPPKSPGKSIPPVQERSGVLGRPGPTLESVTRPVDRLCRRKGDRGGHQSRDRVSRGRGDGTEPFCHVRRPRG